MELLYAHAPPQPPSNETLWFGFVLVAIVIITIFAFLVLRYYCFPHYYEKIIRVARKITKKIK